MSVTRPIKLLWLSLLLLLVPALWAGVASTQGNPAPVLTSGQTYPGNPPPARPRLAEGQRLMAPGAPVARPGVILRGQWRQPIEVRMMVIHASNATQGYDEPIRDFERYLKILNYKGFRLLFHNAMMLRPGTTRTLGLFDGKMIEVTLKAVTPEKAFMFVRMHNPQDPSGVSLETDVSVTRRGTFFIGGPRYKEGVLLLPITAWY